MSDSNRIEVLFQLFIKKMNKLKQKITNTDYQQQLQDEVGLICPFERAQVVNYDDRRGR